MTAAALMSAALYAYAQPPTFASALAYVCFVPWLYAVWSQVAVSRAERCVRGAISGFILGTAAAFFCGSWLPETLSTFGMGIASQALATVLAAVWTKGIGFAALGLCASLLGSLGAPGRIAGFALGLVAVEGVLSTPWWGAPWTLLAHSQAGVAGVSQLAALGGVSAISWLVAAVNAALVTCALDRLSPRSIRLCASLIGVVALLSIAAMPVLELLPAEDRGSGRALLIVQPNIARGERWMPSAQRTHLVSALTQAAKAVQAQGAHASRIVVLPEMLVTSPIERSPEIVAELKGFTRGTNSELIVGVAREARSGRPDRYRNSILWLGVDGSLVASMDKALAIPMAEEEGGRWLLPGLAGLFGVGARVEEASLSTRLFGDGTFAAMLCYEVLFPSAVAARRSSGTQAILVLADDSWVPGRGASDQALAAATFRAIEQRLPLVRVALRGPSQVVDPWGRPLAELPANETGALEVELPRSVPVRKGELLALTASIIVGAASAWLGSAAVLRRLFNDSEGPSASLVDFGRRRAAGTRR